ncbi:MAG: hypothetical protein M1572_01075 [Gammaproteobacteria bacterium]|nr:hypothetical protein [Gammaproteobacteria bacterium]OYY24712.1 MAG: hypothetical protein B7Y68_02700 [Thiotrichales bacterium 35-46-9]OYZ07454.1 MAG: hypothetical protein B7Y29_04480 [Thiotrichales bacterium 16-46-22]OYZ41318.1 MAG: hypothetical protein B7Y18_02075 [Thiotrichales bacterium 24-47-4]OZA74626.1 MAG: hypothetical protein B7X74_02155 [Thiotrichales bacterium 39-47-5]HQR81913.1 hypothetical protein [Thiotrichales bacterium]
MSTLEDKLAAGIAQVKNTSRTRKTPAKAAPAGSIPAALSADNLPASSTTAKAAPAKTVAPSAAPAPTAAVKPVVTEAPKRVYLADERVWPD